jgi:hypothetical protein
MLTDRMKKDKKVGAVSSRIHPIGSGPLIWYQVIHIFLYCPIKKRSTILFLIENGICNVLLVTKNN